MLQDLKNIQTVPNRPKELDPVVAGLRRWPGPSTAEIGSFGMKLMWIALPIDLIHWTCVGDVVRCCKGQRSHEATPAATYVPKQLKTILPYQCFHGMEGNNYYLTKLLPMNYHGRLQTKAFQQLPTLQ